MNRCEMTSRVPLEPGPVCNSAGSRHGNGTVASGTSDTVEAGLRSYRAGKMKLRLSCWAENVRAKAAFAVVTALHADSRPSVVGKTESLHIPRGQGETADFAKTFLIDYELGQEDSPIVVSLYDGKSLIASALFDVDRVLGMSGVLAKQLSSGVTIAGLSATRPWPQECGWDWLLCQLVGSLR